MTSNKQVYFSSTTSDLQRSLLEQQMKEEQENEKEEKKERPGELYHKKSQQEEFFGVPLSKKKPETVEDLLAKLRMPFKGPDELLSFYETNRPLFKGNSYSLIFHRK